MSCLVEHGPIQELQTPQSSWQNDVYRWLAMHPRLGNRYAVRFMSTARVGRPRLQMKVDSDYAAIHNGVGVRLAWLEQFIAELL